MTAVNGRHAARLFDDTRPIRRPAAPRREWVDAWAAGLAAFALLAVALVYAIARGGLG